MSVCQQSTITVGLLNERNATLYDIELGLELPCGLRYVPQTVSGLRESDISNLQQSEFILDSLEPGDSVALQWEVVVSCQTVRCIDAGDLFQHVIHLRQGGSNTQFLSPIYNVETAYPVIYRIEDPLFKAAKGESLSRSITLRNTRPGRLEQFRFRDDYTQGVRIQMPGRDTVSTSTGHIEILLDDDDFLQIGNGDAYFDFNEELVIREEIDVISCAFDQRFSVSRLSLQWGCDSNFCQTYLRRAKVQIESAYDEGNVLQAETQKQEVYCREGGQNVQQSLRLTHTGKEAEIYNLRIYVEQISEGYSIAAGSVLSSLPIDTVLYRSPTGDVCSGEGFRQAEIRLSSLNVGESLEVLFDSRVCINGCGMAQNAWRYRFEYDKACAPPDEKYISVGNRQVGSVDSLAIDAQLTVESVNYPLERGDEVTIVQNVRHPLLTASSGQMEIYLKLPCPLLPGGNDFSIGGKAPVEQELISSATAQELRLVYALPFPENQFELRFPAVLTCDSACAGANCYLEFITSCPMSCFGKTTIGKIQRTISINPGMQCAAGNEVKLCDEIDVEYICLDQPCIENALGYLDYDLQIYRTNFGLPDNDDDHIADGSGTIDKGKVALRTIMQGDTFVYDFNGVVIEDVPGKARFSHGLVTMRAEVKDFRYAGSQDDEDLYLDDFFNDEQRIRMLSTSLRIVDQSAGKTYLLDRVPFFYDPFLNDLDFSIKSLDLALINPGFPANFLFEKGDSVQLKVTNILDYNFPRRQQDPMEMDIEFEHKIFLDTTGIDKKRTFYCECRKETLGLRGYFIEHAVPSRPSRSYCEEQFQLFDMQLRVVVDRDRNDFPYEIRSPYTFDSLKILVGEDIILDSIRYVLKGSGPIQTWILPGSDREINFKALEDMPLDEFGEQDFLFYGMGDECVSAFSDERFALDFWLQPQENPGYFDPYLLDLDPGVDNQSQPRLEPDVNEPFVETLTDTIVWEYNVVVTRTNSINTWLQIDERPDFELLNVSSVEHPVQSFSNGIYQFGEIPEGDTLRIEITALAKSCKEIKAPLSMGSNCMPKTRSIQPSCVEISDELVAFVLKGKAENFIESEEIEIPLCQPSGSITTTIFNADRGHLKDMLTTLEAPTGFHIISGSVELAYPTGSGRWHFIEDPDILSSQLYQWEWAGVDSSVFANGLNGVADIPQNGFDIRFAFTTDCNFKSGSKLIFRTLGENFCGQYANNIAKVSGTIHIDDVDPPYNSSIGLIEFREADCVQDAFLAFRVSTTGLPGERDSLFIRLPENYVYKPGSAPFPPEQTGNQLRWPLDSVLTVDSFYCAMGIEGEVFCGQDILSVYTATKDSAYCVEDSLYCDLSVINGRIDLPVVFSRPEIQLNSMRVLDRTAAAYKIELEVENISNITQSGVWLDFYLDIDGVAGFSPGDSLLFSKLFDEDIENGTTAAFVLDSLFMPLSSFCKLLAVVPKNKNCLCRGDAIFMQSPITLSIDSVIRSCPGQKVDIGIDAVAGMEYRWLERGLVECEDCARTSFYAENQGQSRKTYDFTLLAEDTLGCSFQYHLKAEIQPLPRLLSDDQKICPFDTIYLFSTEGQNYSWEGDGIVDIEENAIVAAPTVNGFIKVSVEDELGCEGSDSIFVEVLPEAIANAGPDRVFCFGEREASLDADYYPGLEYRWLYATNSLDDPFVHDPKINNEVSRPYVLEVFNGLCVDYDTVEVVYEKGLEISGVADSIVVCAGQTLHWQLEGGVEYQWIPYYDGMCVDTSCAEVMLNIPNDSFFVTVIGRDVKGCIDSLRYYLRGYVDTPLIEIDTQLCLYEKLDWRGRVLDREGVYCDTVPLKGRCAEITCLTVDYIEMDTLRSWDTLCLGDSLQFFGRTFSSNGTFYHQPDSMTCDTVYRLDISYFEQVENIADSTLLKKDMCEDMLIPFPEIFEEYRWQPEDGLDCSFCPQPNIINNDFNRYTVEVRDENGCWESFDYLLEFERCVDRDIYIPNIFTPNEDDKNDVFTVYPRKNVLSILGMKIFNRWGSLIYEFRGLEGGNIPQWDGKFRGKYCDQGTYVYTLKVKWQDGTITDFAGDITLDR